LSLSGLWRAQVALADAKRSPAISKIRSCIIVFYYGGPSHLDTYDMKPNAPADVRGEFQSIETSVPGLRISEHLPHMAKVMHKVAIVRSMTHQVDNRRKEIARSSRRFHSFILVMAQR